MKTTKQWIEHFKMNSLEKRVDWNLRPQITHSEISEILSSLQAWQLGETSDGTHLIRAATKYSKRVKDKDYVEAVRLFIAEEQKHGNNLGKYLDAINQPKLKQNWGDSLFRKIRYYNANMEIWTVAVITVESAAQVFYQAVKDATGCTLLKQICTDILIDEAYHIDFQTERLEIILEHKSATKNYLCRVVYPIFFFATALVVWLAHKRTFTAGKINFKRYFRKMRYKYFKTLHKAMEKKDFAAGYKKHQRMSTVPTA